MSTVTKPQARIALGWVVLQGQRVPVEVDMEWDRFLDALLLRAGGITGPTIDVAAILAAIAAVNQKPAVVLSADEDGESWPMIPGPAGAAGAPGMAWRGLDGEDGETLFMLQPAKYRAPLNATRALNTTYTNSSVDLLLVQVTLRCAVTLAGGNAYAQAKMDTATPPTVIASGLVGIEAGLLGEDNSFQLSFIVNPGGTYIVTTSATNGTVTLGNWFEVPI